MKEQIDKAVGLIALGFILVVTAIVGIVWEVIPSIIFVALISGAISWIVWMLSQNVLSFQLIWLTITVLMYAGFMINQRKVEKQAKEECEKMMKENNDD